MKVDSVIISCQHVMSVICMIMPITWRYTDIYGGIICYITDNLDPTNYLLNFGVIALHETRPKVIIRFTLKNIRNNLKQSWTQLFQGETLEDLFDGVYGAVEIHKLDVWWNRRVLWTLIIFLYYRRMIEICKELWITLSLF